MVLTLEKLGIPVETYHCEVATGGQGEIDMRFTTLTRIDDNGRLYKVDSNELVMDHCLVISMAALAINGASTGQPKP
jgi:glutamine synthetase